MNNIKSKIIFILILISVCISCTRNSDNRIILTNGLSEDPSNLRYGIEITEHELFYCQETKPQSEIYFFYSVKIKPDICNNITKELSNSFLKRIESFPSKDGQSYELQYTFKKDIRKFLFDLDLLNDNQITVIRKITNLKELKMEKIDYHAFPDRLLKARFPEPPPAP